MKALIKVNYREYVVPAEVGVQIMELLEGAKIWHSEYHVREKEMEPYHTYHAYDEEDGSKPKNLELIPEALYRMAKLAGKPVKE